MGNYFKLAKGKITPTKGEGEQTSMMGTLTSVWVKNDEFKNSAGQDVSIEKLYFTLKNEQGYNHLSTYFDSTIAQRLISYLGSADLTQEIEINTSLDDKGHGQVFVKQGDAYLKGSFKSSDLPSWEKIQVSRTQSAWNKDAFLDALKAKVDQLSSKLPKFDRAQEANPQPTGNRPPASTYEPDDLPF